MLHVLNDANDLVLAACALSKLFGDEQYEDYAIENQEMVEYYQSMAKTRLFGAWYCFHGWNSKSVAIKILRSDLPGAQRLSSYFQRDNLGMKRSRADFVPIPLRG